MNDTAKESLGGIKALQKDNPNLDFLRATAVSMVVGFHLLAYFGIWSQYKENIKMIGFGGVLFFFVHTSLVLMYSLDRLSGKLHGAGLYAGFVIRRIFRIYPLSILTVAVIAIFHLPIGDLKAFAFEWVPMTKLGVVSNLLLAQNLTNTKSIVAPLWSLPFEMQMYFFLPFLFIFARRIRSVVPLLLLWCGTVIIGLIHYRFGHLPDFVRYVPCFIPGIIAFKLGEKEVRRLPFILWPAFLALVLAFWITVPGIGSSWVGCLFVGLAIPRFAILSSAWIRKTVFVIAKYSYGVYLWHYFCIWLAFLVLRATPWPVHWLVFLASIVAIPYVLFHTLEQPMIRLGGRIVDALFRASAPKRGIPQAEAPA